MNPAEAGLEILSIRRTRKEEILLVLKKVGDVLAFKKAFDQAVGWCADLRALVATRSVEVRDLDVTVTREEIAAALSGALGKEELGAPYRLYPRLGGVKAAVMQLAGADAESLLRLGRKDVCWRCGDTKHVAKECAGAPRCLTCLDRGINDIAHAAGAAPDRCSGRN